MSGEFSATLYGGERSTGIAAQVCLSDADHIQVSTEEGVNRHAIAEISVSSRLGNSVRYLTLPGGEKLETQDNDAVDRLLEAATTSRPHGLLHALEAQWGWVGIAVVFTCAFLWWSVFIGLPLLADRTARAIPISLEDAMGRQSLSTLDNHLLSPTRLEEVQRERVRRLFDTATEQAARDSDLDSAPTLQLRRAQGLGPNAFALPSGIVVVTDELVMLAEQDGELLGVIAHELGHVQHRHIMRSVLQNSAVALVLATILGDVSSITGLAASIPTLLVEQGYSRAFEFEADRYAGEMMDALGIERAHLASMLAKLGDAHGAGSSGIGDYLSTHPAMDRRIEAIKEPSPTTETSD